MGGAGVRGDRLPTIHTGGEIRARRTPVSLSPLIKFGTSTWTYEGWQGLVYHKLYPKGRFKQDCLAEYAEYEYAGERLFRTVGFDFSFYGPPTPKQLAHYAQQLPVGFQACAKVWEEITVPVFAPGLRSGARAGPNPHFLDVEYFQDLVVAPFDEAFRGYTGPFIFEFQRTGIEPRAFLQKLDAFLGRLPKDHRYAVEVRNSALLGREYHAILQRHGVAHVFNHLYGMPPLSEQHQRLNGTFTAPFMLIRLLTPPDLPYQQAVKAYQPYDRIVRPLPRMRDETVTLLGHAVQEQREAYVLVNNRSEGSAPLTVQALVDQIRKEQTE